MLHQHLGQLLQISPHGPQADPAAQLLSQPQNQQMLKMLMAYRHLSLQFFKQELGVGLWSFPMDALAIFCWNASSGEGFSRRSTIQQNHISYVYVYSKILNAISNAKLELDSVHFSIMRKLLK